MRLFGQLEAADGGVAFAVRGAKQRALLALLALHRGEPVSADRLIDALWGDGQAANPVNALQAQIGQLRRTLGVGAIVTTEAGYALAVGPDEVDVVRFEQLVAKGRRLAEQGEMALASATLAEALGLRRGEPLAEFAYAGFADTERAQLDELTLVAIETRAGADLVLGRHGELAGELEAQCREHPLRERLWELLILALYRAGRQADALHAYTEVRDRLADELGIDPGPPLRELQGRILTQDSSLAAASPAPVRATTPAASAGNLRERLSSFIGRDTELEQLREAVRSSRLVTLTGPGGTGKTSLAVEAAAALRAEYPDGAWLVELAGVAGPDGVAPAVASALGAAASALGGPHPAGSAAELIVGHLAGRSLVVVLDNCEHVIGEAAALADTLARAVPGLRLIATSREALGIPGEVLLPVTGLAIPAAEAVCADEKVPDSEILDVLSRLVGKSLVTGPGAAGEARFTQLQTLWQYGRDRLEDSGEADAMRARHGTYYLQMAEQAREGLRGVTGPVWRDRITSESGNLRAALDWHIAAADADAALSLASGIAWLWFINGEFAEGARWLGDALGADGTRRAELEATARVWHGYCVGMSASPAAGINECEEAIAVLQAAGSGARLAEALVLYAAVLGFASRFRKALEILGEARDLLEPSRHGWILATHDMMAVWNLLPLGRLEDAEPVARSSLERFDTEGEVLLVVSPLHALASIAEARGDLDAASAAYEDLLKRCRATRQRIHMPLCLVALGALRARQGDDAAADRLYEEAIGCSSNSWLSADAMVGQAAVARRLGDLARARTLLDAAGSQYRQLDFPVGPPTVLAGLAWWALAADRLGEAAVFAANAAEGAAASGDRATQLLAATAVAAVKAAAEPTRHNIDAFAALAHQRARRGSRIAPAPSPMSQTWPRSRPAWRCPLTERPGLAKTALATPRSAAFLRAPVA